MARDSLTLEARLFLEKLAEYRMYRKVYEITGYIDAYGDTHCVACTIDPRDNFGAECEQQPIRQSDEWETKPHCATCGRPIDCFVRR
jgi:hypothetical protein